MSDPATSNAEDPSSAGTVATIRDSGRLYWSVRGEVACQNHAPEPSSPRWTEARWAPVPATRLRSHGTLYQCQYCNSPPTPIGHRRLTGHAPLILVVDDFEDARDMYAEYLTFKRYRVIVASNGREAVEQARAHRPDLMLLDLRMPILTGVDTLRLLRADASLERTRIIALTAYALDDERAQALAQGFDAVLLKPCLPDDLVATIEALLTSTATAPHQNLA